MITDHDIERIAEHVKDAVWRSFDAHLSDRAKDVVTAGEVSTIAKETRSATYQALFRLKMDEQK